MKILPNEIGMSDRDSIIHLFVTVVPENIEHLANQTYRLVIQRTRASINWLNKLLIMEAKPLN